MQEINTIDHKRLHEIARRLEFFNKFTDDELKEMLNFDAHLCVYQKDEFIIKEGNHDKSFYIIISGKVDIIKSHTTHPLTTMEPGNFFGEISFLTDSQRTVNVKASDTVISIIVDKNLLEKLTSETREKIKDKIIEKLVQRLDEMNKAVSNLLQI